MKGRSVPLVGTGQGRLRDLPEGLKLLARIKEKTPSPDCLAQPTMHKISAWGHGHVANQ